MPDLPHANETIAALCPELRAIVDTERALGNEVAETWTNWGTGVLLAQPFRTPHPTSEYICFRAVSDPHYWKAEYACDALKQIVACRF